MGMLGVFFCEFTSGIINLLSLMSERWGWNCFSIFLHSCFLFSTFFFISPFSFSNFFLYFSFFLSIFFDLFVSLFFSFDYLILLLFFPLFFSVLFSLLFTFLSYLSSFLFLFSFPPDSLLFHRYFSDTSFSIFINSLFNNSSVSSSLYIQIFVN